MGYCLNKNDKGYKQLDKEFGTTATEMLVRVYNRYTPQFVYPSVAQAHKFFKDFFKNQVFVIEAALDFDLNNVLNDCSGRCAFRSVRGQLRAIGA